MIDFLRMSGSMEEVSMRNLYDGGMLEPIYDFHFDILRILRKSAEMQKKIRYECGQIWR